MAVALVPLLPLFAVLLSLLPVRHGFAAGVTVAASVASLGLAIADALAVAAGGRVVVIPGWIVLDGFGALLLLVIAFVVTTAALFSWGYLAAHESDARRIRVYCAHFNLFAFSLVLVPVLAEPALVWIAVEFTSVFSVLLVAFDRTATALEAAWKYIALMFAGAAIALLGFFLLFWAERQAGAAAYSWEGLRAAAPAMPSGLLVLAVVLVLVGLGVKVGFVPLHTWLPDAHSQAPAPVCGLLSGVKTTNSLYVILRLVALLPMARAASGMIVVGLLSTGVASFLLLQVRDYKRLFAYSTVEHMGIIAVASGIGTVQGTTAAMLQIVAHSLTKSFCFYAAGAVLLVSGTREIGAVRGLIRTAPVAATALMIGGLAIGGAPPFAVFVSEFAILRAGLAAGRYVAMGLLALFIAVAFFGVLRGVSRMVLGQPLPVDRPASHPRLPLTCVLALGVAAVPVLALGWYQPSAIHALVLLAAGVLAPVTP